MTDRSSWPKNPYKKQYVRVRVDFDKEGSMFPRAIIWTDGQEYPIDRINDLRSAPARKAGGQGDRYTVEICGQERFLFFEHNPDDRSERIGKWFLEVRNPEV